MLLTLANMIMVARDLTEPGEPNTEYIRGQVNLITDMYGLSGNDEVHDLITSIISHTATQRDTMRLWTLTEELHS